MSQLGVFSDNPPGSIDIVTITGNSGGAVPPNGSGNINIVGAGSTTVTGNPATNTLTILVDNSGFTWTDQSGAFAAAESMGYFITGASTATLPASPSQGDTIKFNVDTASALTIQANTGQFVRISTSLSSSAGTAVNTFQGDAITLVYRSTGTTWHADVVIGVWGVT